MRLRPATVSKVEIVSLDINELLPIRGPRSIVTGGIRQSARRPA
jgi:hypothetical protein